VGAGVALTVERCVVSVVPPNSRPVLLGLGALFVILYWTGKSARARKDAEFRALVRAERLARGRPPRDLDPHVPQWDRRVSRVVADHRRRLGHPAGRALQKSSLTRSRSSGARIRPYMTLPGSSLRPSP
jgi:hypothetical protein